MNNGTDEQQADKYEKNNVSFIMQIVQFDYKSQPEVKGNTSQAGIVVLAACIRYHKVSHNKTMPPSIAVQWQHIDGAAT